MALPGRGIVTFNSLGFLWFFAAVTALYFAVPHRWRWALLLLASYGFCVSWRPAAAGALAASTVVTYLAALGVAGKRDGHRHREFLWFGFLANIGALLFFKYFNFLNTSFRGGFTSLGLPYGVPTLDLLLPVGISFYTLKAVGYLIDVYRGDVPPERHFGRLALFLSFFPQLIAGPIDRSKNLLPQFRAPVDFEYQRVRDGMRLMLWGYFQKVVIADRLAVVVDRVYGNPHGLHGAVLTLSAFLYTFQLYCDFAGYTDIARGAAQVLGFETIRNFERPYGARTIQEFWKRWHISLTSWFRDYLYFPMGGNRVGPVRWVINVVTVFLVSGLWHGANWTFVLWGALHACYYLGFRYTVRLLAPLREISRVSVPGFLKNSLAAGLTFCLVSFAWIFFRAHSISDAVYIVSHLGDRVPELLRRLDDVGYVRSIAGQMGVEQQEVAIALFSLGVFFVVQKMGGWEQIMRRLDARSVVYRWAAYYLVFGMVVFFGAFNAGQGFIYAQF